MHTRPSSVQIKPPLAMDAGDGVALVLAIPEKGGGFVTSQAWISRAALDIDRSDAVLLLGESALRLYEQGREQFTEETGT